MCNVLQTGSWLRQFRKFFMHKISAQISLILAVTHFLYSFHKIHEWAILDYIRFRLLKHEKPAET